MLTSVTWTARGEAGPPSAAADASARMRGRESVREGRLNTENKQSEESKQIGDGYEMKIGKKKRVAEGKVMKNLEGRNMLS